MLAERSCRSCRLRKRRCTRELPACRLCIRHVQSGLYLGLLQGLIGNSGRRSCSYQTTPDSENLPIQSAEVESNAALSKQALRNNFPVASFIDPAVFSYCASLATLYHDIPIPARVQYVLGNIGERKAVAERYFRTAHRWMPVVSRFRFYGSLMNPTREADPSFIALLLSMKLILSRPAEADMRSEIYTLTKEFQLRTEMAGYLSIYSVQSSILTALYEMGNAILPGAFTTVSTSARHAIALGITGPTQVQGKSWLEQEERNRTWWAIIILDRLVNLGFRGSHLCTPDPSMNSQLPIDDDAWDQGVLPNDQSQTLFSTPCMKDGRYARLAQAANLLSQVYQHVSSREEDMRLDLDNIDQLERTLFALERLGSIEEQENDVCCFCSIATCYSAILLLRTTYLSESPEKLTSEGIEQSHRSIRTVAAKSIYMLQTYYAGQRGTIENVPPLALDWLYRPIVAHIFLAHGAPSSEWELVIPQLEKALERLGQRWTAASESET